MMKTYRARLEAIAVALASWTIWSKGLEKLIGNIDRLPFFARDVLDLIV